MNFFKLRRKKAVKKERLSNEEIEKILSRVETGEYEKKQKNCGKYGAFVGDMSQLCLLNQDAVQMMSYQTWCGTMFSDKRKDDVLKKFNRRVVRNYILSFILGGLVVGGVVVASKVKQQMTKQITENSIQNQR